MEKVPYLDTELWKIQPHSNLYKYTIEFLHTTWGTSNHTFFPGAQPISIERSHFGILKRADYVVCEKTDGIRHVCACFKFEDKKMCVLIDRSQNLYLLPLRIPLGNTLLDGELVKDNQGVWHFMIYDCLMAENAHVSHLDLFERLKSANGFVSKIMKLVKDPVIFKLKTFWNLKDVKNFMKQEFPYKTDGIVLTPVKDPIRSGTHETMFKWKPRDANTIDFQFKRRNTKWGLYVQEKGKLIFESELSVFENDGIKEDAIIECQYVHWEFPRYWRPIQVRTDKTYPNNRRTFYRTLANIAENIQLAEFERL